MKSLKCRCLEDKPARAQLRCSAVVGVGVPEEDIIRLALLVLENLVNSVQLLIQPRKDLPGKVNTAG